MTFAEFWGHTPAEVVLAIDAHQRRERAEFWRSGLVAAAVVNSAFGRKRGKAAKPEDFIPRVRRTETQTAEQMAAKLRGYTVALGGQVIDTTAGGGSHAQP